MTGSGHYEVDPFTLPIGSLNGVPTTLSQDNLNTISWLVHNGNAAIAGGATALVSAEYQVAIWKTEYEPTSEWMIRAETSSAMSLA